MSGAKLNTDKSQVSNYRWWVWSIEFKWGRGSCQSFRDHGGDKKLLPAKFDSRIALHCRVQELHRKSILDYKHRRRILHCHPDPTRVLLGMGKQAHDLDRFDRSD